VFDRLLGAARSSEEPGQSGQIYQTARIQGSGVACSDAYASAVAPAAALADRHGWKLEWQATTVPVEEEIGFRWLLVYIPLDRDNWPTRVTRPCPRGPEAIGLGPDWREWGEGLSKLKQV
jgi:hypothetical protein